MEMHDDVSDDERLSQLRRRTSHEREARRRAELPVVLASADHRPGALKRRADSGELVRLTNGHYCAPPPQDWPIWRRRQYLAYARARGAALAARAQAAVGGIHAAVLHGLPALEVPASVQVHGAGHPSTSHRHLGLRRVVRAQAVGDVVTVDGMRVTSLERTAIDCARHLPIDEAVVIVDAVLHRLADPEPWRRADGDRRITHHKRRLRDVLNAEARTSGNARARTAVELADGWAESPMESLLHRAIEVVGLGRPKLQASVLTRRGRFFADALLEGTSPDGTPWRLVIEADGQEKWVTPADLRRHRDREEEIRRAGAAFLSVRWSMVRQAGLSDLTELLAASVPAHVRDRMQAVDRWKTPMEREAGLAMERPGFWQR